MKTLEITRKSGGDIITNATIVVDKIIGWYPYYTMRNNLIHYECLIIVCETNVTFDSNMTQSEFSNVYERAINARLPL